MGIGYGGIIQYKIGSASAVVLGLTRNIEPKYKIDEKDTSTNDNTARTRTFEPGFVDTGTIAVTMLYLKTTITNLLAAVASYTALPVVLPVWTHTFRDGSTWVGSGFHTSMDSSHMYDDEETLSFDIKGQRGMGMDHRI